MLLEHLSVHLIKIAKTQGSLLSSPLGRICCCCCSIGLAFSGATEGEPAKFSANRRHSSAKTCSAEGGRSQFSAIPCHSRANSNRAARVCSFSAADAASKQVLARRRYSALVTTTAPEATLQMRPQSLDHPAEPRSEKMAPHTGDGAKSQVRQRGASKRKPPRAHTCNHRL